MSTGPDGGLDAGASVGLSLASVLLVVYGLKQLTVDGSAGGAGPLVAGGAIVVGVLAGVVFVRRQLRLVTPLLNLRPSANRPFAAVLVALVFAGIAMAGIAVPALGTGPLFALGTGLVVGSVPPERAGSAASMSEAGNYLGGCRPVRRRNCCAPRGRRSPVG